MEVKEANVTEEKNMSNAELAEGSVDPYRWMEMLWNKAVCKALRPKLEALAAENGDRPGRFVPDAETCATLVKEVMFETFLDEAAADADDPMGMQRVFQFAALFANADGYWPDGKILCGVPGQVLFEEVDGVALVIGIREGWITIPEAEALARLRFRLGHPDFTYIRGMQKLMLGRATEDLSEVFAEHGWQAIWRPAIPDATIN